MNHIPLRVVLLISASILAQTVVIGLLPRTRGFTAPLATSGCVAALVFSSWMAARVTQEGVDIGVLIPFMAALVPLAAVAIGIVLYGEAASPLRVAMLAGACGLVGMASRYG